MGLIRAEFVRFISRRFFRGLAIVLFAALLLAVGLVFAHSSKDPNSGLAQAQAEVAACRNDQARGLKATSPGPGAATAQIECPTVEQLRPQFDRRFRYATTIPDMTRSLAEPLFVLALLVGASFLGAEWGTGFMTTLLTWEPRRERVLAAKWIAAVVCIAVAGAAVMALIAVLFLPVAALRGTTAGVTGGLWRTLSGLWLRDGAVAAVGATFGAAFATIARNTAGAAGFGVAYVGFIDPLISIIYRGRFRPWLLHRNIEQFMGLNVELSPAEEAAHAHANGFFTAVHLGTARPTILLVAYALGILAVAYAFFRQRDVT
jgi:ABC-2 type transport system permease protein